MLKLLSKKLSMDSLVLILLVVLVGFTIHIKWSDLNAMIGFTSEEVQKSAAITDEYEENQPWKFSIYPTNVESFDNGTHSLRLNEQLRIKFIPELENGKVTWPQASGGKRVATVHDTRLSRRLSEALVSGRTVSGTEPLKITGIQTGIGKDTAEVTFNGLITVKNLRLSEPGGLNVDWPTRSFRGSQVELISAKEKLRNELVRRLRDAFNYDVKRDGVPVFDPPENGIRAEVIRVFDGDTIKARLMDGSGEEVTVRIRGMDCPESSRNAKCESSDYSEKLEGCAEEIPYGKRATRVATNWLANNEVILVPGTDSGEFERGNFGRLLAYVRLRTGEDYGLKMLKNGYCKDFSESFDHPRSHIYRQLQSPLKPLD